MAKTASQIRAEKKERNEKIQQVVSHSKTVDSQNTAAAEKSKAKTLEVLNKAISGAADPTKKSALSRAAQMVTDGYKKASAQQKTGPKTATDLQKKKEDQADGKHPVDSLQIRKDRAQKALDDFDNNKEIDRTDTNQRKAYDAERKRLQDEVDRAGAEIDAREDARTHDTNMERIAAMSDEDREQLQQYIESRDARRSVFANPISWYQGYNKETENKNSLIDKYGEEELAKLAEIYSRHLHEQNAKKTVEDTQESVNQNWIAAALHNIAAVPARAMGGIEAMAGRLYEQADRTGQYRTLEENTAGDTLSLYGNTVSGQTAQNIAGENGNVVRGALSIGYQGVMSVVDSIARTFFGGGAAGSAALAATNSFTQTVSEATKQGANPQQAVAMGIANAGMEYITEKIPMDEVFKVAKSGNVKVLEQAFKQVGIEITTEELSLFGSMAAEAAILREKSSYKQQIGDLVANGASYEEAKAQANRGVWEEVKQTALVSGFAGFLSGGGGAIVGNLATNNAPEVTTEAPQEVPAEVAPAAPVVDEGQQIDDAVTAEPSTAPLVDGIQDMTPAPAPLAEGQRNFMAAMDAALGNQPAQQPVIEPAVPQEETAYQDEFEDWGKDPNREGIEELVQQDNETGSIKEQIRNSQDKLNAMEPVASIETPKGFADLTKTERKNTDFRESRGIRNVNNLVSQKDESKKGKPVYMEYNDLAPGNTYFGPKAQSDSNGSSDVSFTFNDDGTLDLKVNESNNTYNTISGYKTRGYMYYYDIYVNGKKVNDANEVSGYYSMKNAEVDKKPILREIPGGNMLLKEKGKLHFYSDDFQKPIRQTNAEKPQPAKSETVQEPQQAAEAIYNTGAGLARQNVQDGNYMGDSAWLEDDVDDMEWFTSSVPENRPEVNGNSPTESDYYDEFAEFGTGGANREEFLGRDWYKVGKRNVKAYMYENPEVKPYFQMEAQLMLMELADSTRGERTYNEKVHYESSGEKGWSGVKRHTSEDIAYLLDTAGFSYAEIEKGLNAIIEDNGAENNAASKRIEFILHNRLMNGHKDFYGDRETYPDGRVPASDEYVQLINDKQITAYDNEPDAVGDNLTATASSPKTEDSRTMPTKGGQPQIKGTGAAEGNFSGKPAYNATLSEDNSQADRRDDVRPMELPQRDINGGNISAVTGNVYGSRITPDELASLMEEPTARGDFTYAKISNDRATELAVDTISRSGDWNTAYSQWVREVDRGVAGAEMTARGALLMNHAAQEGNKAKWLDILSDMQRLGTNTAQGLQAFRIIRTLSAPDKIEFAKVTVRKMVQDLNLGVEINIDETLLNKYEQAQTDEERDAILLDIQQNVADQIPSTLLDKWTALRYMNMLGNLKTNVRNVMGNVGSSLVYRMKDQIATTMERITGTQRTKSHTVSRELLTVCKQDFEQFKDVVSSGGKYSDNFSSNDQFRQGVMDKRRIFKNPLLEGYRKGTNWMMNNGIFGDEAFGRAAYARALAGFLKANGVTAEQFQQMVNEKPKSGTGTPKAIIPDGTRVKAADRDNYGTIQKYNEADNTYLVQFVSPKGQTANVNLSADILSPVGKKTDALGPVPKPEQKMEFVDYARAYAIREAQEATFHDNSALAEIMSNVQKSTGIIGQAIIPFTKTPANVLTRAVEFSPLGIINSTVKTIQAKRDVDISGADIVNSWAKTMSGTALFALGAAMMGQGLLSGGPDEDEEKAEFDELNGKQNYAIQLPDGTNYTIDWLTPAAMPMFMGAQFWDIITREEDFSFADMEKVFTSIADPMIQMSMLQGLNDSLDSIKYSDNNLGQFFINAAVSYLTQGLTNTLFSQIERSTEENRQTTYVDKDSNIPEWMQRQLGKASQKIPGWDFQQMDYRNAWGQTEENEGGLLYNMLSPGYVSKEQSNQITQELYRLRETTGENVFPQPVDKTITYTDVTGEKHVNRALTQSELDTIQRVEGQTAMRLIAEVVMNGDYKSLTDNQRAEVVSNIYKYAQEQGKKEALSDYYSEAAAWLQNIGDDAANSLIQRAALSTINASVTKIVDNIENEWAVSPAAQKELDGLFDAYSGMSRDAQKQILEDAVSDTAKYLEIRSKGIDTTQYLDVVRGIKALEVEPNYSDIRDIQVREAIADSSSLSRAEKDYVMKAYMPDYNPNAKQPQTTELKYDAIRELGVSPDGYTKAYRAYLDASGTGKRRRTIDQYMKSYGWDRSTAQKVYDIYAGYYKPWE